MKNTVRTHHKAGTKRPSSQPQTGHGKKSVEENIRIIVKSHQDDDIADFEIPETKYDAMLASAKSQGTSLSQWMENACREKFGTQTAPREPEVAKDDVISLMLFSRNQSSSIGAVDFTAEEFQIIQALAAQRKITLDNLLMETAQRMTTHVPILELETAKMQANGLLQILSDTLQHQLNPDGGNLQCRATEDLLNGVMFLVDSTKERLEQAFNTTFAALKQPYRPRQTTH